VEERIKILARCELFSTLPRKGLEMAASRCVPGEAKKGESVVVEGKPADGLYVVVRGKVDYIKKVEEKRGLVLTCARSAPRTRSTSTASSGKRSSSKATASAR